VFGLVLAWGVRPASAAPSHTPEPVVIARADVMTDRATPPVLFAQSMVPATPAVAIQPALPAPLLAQSRVVTPDGSQPGVLWLIAMGAVLYRFGARFLRVS
jgi:hypothetical protein